MRATEFINIFDASQNTSVEEGWKDWVAGAALGAAAIGSNAAQAPTKAPILKQQPAVQKTAVDTKKVVQTILKPQAKALISAGVKAGLKGAELAQFVAQCAHETANFTHMVEKGGKLDFKKYEPKSNPRLAKILGNKVTGDGVKYHGRGYIQLTGRDNYARAGQALGLPLEKHPELVERPDVAAKVAVWFWQTRVQPKVTNFNDTAAVTKPINSGLHGLDNRHDTFSAIMRIMKKS